MTCTRSLIRVALIAAAEDRADHWQQAKRGEGRVVLISGEPGIGKSRLTAELSERIHSEPQHARTVFVFATPPGQRALSVHHPA